MRGVVRSFGAGLALWTALVSLDSVALAQFFRAGDEIQANAYTTSNQAIPAVAISPSGDFVVAWQSLGQDFYQYGVFARLFSSDGVPNSLDIPINTTGVGQQTGPDLDMDQDGNFVVAWTSTQNGVDEVFGRRFFYYGQPNGGEFQVNNASSGSNRLPAVGVRNDGAFVVVWSHHFGDGDVNVLARRYDSAGAALATQFVVNAYTTGPQEDPDVAMGNDGDFVVTWRGTGTAATMGVWTRRFSSSGTPQASEFRMSVRTGPNHFRPSIAAAADSTFVVTWMELLGDGDSQGIVARRGAGSGSPVGAEFVVNSYTLDNQNNPSIAMENDGDFVIAWHSYRNADTDVWAQRFGASATRLGGEFRVNSYRQYYQSTPAAAAHPTRPEFVIAWQSTFQDGGGSGSFFQRYAGVNMDIDGNGVNEPLKDGLLFLRYMFGFRGAVLIANVVADNCTRCTAPEIEAFIDGIL